MTLIISPACSHRCRQGGVAGRFLLATITERSHHGSSSRNRPNTRSTQRPINILVMLSMTVVSTRPLRLYTWTLVSREGGGVTKAKAIYPKCKEIVVKMNTGGRNETSTLPLFVLVRETKASNVSV